MIAERTIMERKETMNIFVTGATRVLGNAVVSILITRGHHVRALSRSQDNMTVLNRLGAEPISADLFNVESLKQALAGCDAILHLATSIPPTMQVGKLASWHENDRIRREGTHNLVEAALAEGGVHVFIYPSFALVYPDSGDKWIDASMTPYSQLPPCVLRSMLKLPSHDLQGRIAGESLCAWDRSMAPNPLPRKSRSAMPAKG